MTRCVLASSLANGRCLRRGMDLRWYKREVRHDLDLAVVEAQQLGMPNEVVRMLLMVGVRHEEPGIMQQRGVFQQLPRPAIIVQAKRFPLVEQHQSQLDNVRGMGMIYTGCAVMS